ncbi:hypothetical protein [Methanogenium cariaci]|uniref:hypothetical protein n=1 Tax=Methanogenium cariaci TaxID=2197 RepID=UPI00078363D4|nr:hypothetical protein [Methanogenium cariaci]
MNSDTLAVANLAYLTTILYNPNNVAYEASPVTTALEIEAGKQLAGMLGGYDPGKSWGGISPVTERWQTTKHSGLPAI